MVLNTQNINYIFYEGINFLELNLRIVTMSFI
jgi:hypothetical protein